MALLAFFVESGGEIQWTDALAFALDSGARKVAMSGSSKALAAVVAIVAIAFAIKDVVHRGVEEVFIWARAPIEYIRRDVLGKTPSPSYRRMSISDWSDDSSMDDEPVQKWDAEDEKDQIALRAGRMSIPQRIAWGIVGASLLACLASALIFEPGPPYGHVSLTLPLSLLTLLDVSRASVTPEPTDSSWPLSELTAKSQWEMPSGNFKGWAPGADNEYIRKYQEQVPEWLPDTLPKGFGRWHPQPQNDSQPEVGPEFNATDRPYYNPVQDPLKIDNLDGDLLPELSAIFQSNAVNIKHVAVFQIESMRQELFPLTKGSDFYQMIMKSHKEKDREAIERKLERFTPNIEKITGTSGGWNSSGGKTNWNDKSKGKSGGVNVVGSYTAATSSIKSLGAIHCGVWPLAVDSCVESHLQSYQPCLPRVFQLFNEIGKGNSNATDYRGQKWKTAFFQSISDAFDAQDSMDEMIGFDSVVTRVEVDEEIAAGKADEEEINYFGYPETAIKSKIKDFIEGAKENNERMFLSHFTSTTHHPWGIPSWFNETVYMGDAEEGLLTSHEDMNNYLNTIHFTDYWIGEFMQMLEELDVAKETLVVFVGDHGQAFKEDFKVSGTYQNGHISNFRVPISFHHPEIPRVQLAINSTSINILPTILDLLVSTGSLNDDDTAAASDIVHDYEGQSFIRPYKKVHHGRRAWNFGVVNPGSRFLSVTSADAPWRLVIAWDGSAEYSMTNIEEDPLEKNPVTSWKPLNLAALAGRRFGPEAATWVREAEAVAHWWAPEHRRLWEYHEDQ